MKKQLVYLCLVLLAASVGCKGKPTGTTGGTPTPTPGPTASATPTPSTDRYPGLPKSCQTLTNGTGGGSCMQKEQNYDSRFTFVQQISDGLTEFKQLRPELFDNDGDIVKKDRWDDYVKGFMAHMDSKGLCTVYTGYELFVRDSRNISETYTLRMSETNYKARTFTIESCTPARPMPAFQTAPAPNDPWCVLPDSRNDNECTGRSPQWLSTLETMIREIIAEEQTKGAASTIIYTDKPRAGDELGFYIKSRPAFFQRLVEKSHQRNLCAKGYYNDTSGDTFALKSPTGNNAYSEEFDVILDGTNGEVSTRSPHFWGGCAPAKF